MDCSKMEIDESIPDPNLKMLKPSDSDIIECSNCEILEDEEGETDNTSVAMDAAAALLELYKVSSNMKKSLSQVDTSNNEDLEQDIRVETNNMNNIVSEGEKICHAIHEKKN